MQQPLEVMLPLLFSVKGQFTLRGHIPGGGRPLLREGSPISYQPMPEATSPPDLAGGVVQQPLAVVLPLLQKRLQIWLTLPLYVTKAFSALASSLKV